MSFASFLRLDVLLGGLFLGLATVALTTITTAVLCTLGAL